MDMTQDIISRITIFLTQREVEMKTAIHMGAHALEGVVLEEEFGPDELTASTKETARRIAEEITGTVQVGPKSYNPGKFRNTYEESDLGPDMWAFLNEPDQVRSLEVATRLKQPACAGIEKQLVERFGPDLKPRQKQMCGHQIKQVLSPRFKVGNHGVRLKSNRPLPHLFKVGAAYEPADESQTP